jgi:hypothetical protein
MKIERIDVLLKASNTIPAAINITNIVDITDTW